MSFECDCNRDDFRVSEAQAVKAPPLLVEGVGCSSSFAFKDTCMKTASFFFHSKMYNKLSVGYFELKLHICIQGTPEAGSRPILR